MISSNPNKPTKLQALKNIVNEWNGYIQECTSYKKRFITNYEFIIYLIKYNTKRHGRTNSKWFKNFIKMIGRTCYLATYSILGIMDKYHKNRLEQNIDQRDEHIDELKKYKIKQKHK